MVGARVTSNWSLKKLLHWIQGIGEPPDFTTTAKLESALHKGFVYTQERTHILSGSLKASGKTETDLKGYIWTGEIIYGGALIGTPAPGPAHDPVAYAIYEAARGEEHDPLFGVDAVVEKPIKEAIDTHFKRKK